MRSMMRWGACVTALAALLVACAQMTPSPIGTFIASASPSALASMRSPTSSPASAESPATTSPTPSPLGLSCVPQATDVTVAAAQFSDQTGLVDSCDSIPAEPGSGQDQLAVSNPRGDETVLQLAWLGSVCSQPYKFELHATAAGRYELNGTLGPGVVCFAMAPVALELRLGLNEPIDASTVTPTMTFLHASPTP
jgi:hypothetical protein